MKYLKTSVIRVVATFLFQETSPWANPARSFVTAEYTAAICNLKLHEARILLEFLCRNGIATRHTLPPLIIDQREYATMYRLSSRFSNTPELQFEKRMEELFHEAARDERD